MNEIREQIVLLRARSSYMSEAEPIDSAMHSDSADTLEKLLTQIDRDQPGQSDE